MLHHRADRTLVRTAGVIAAALAAVALTACSGSSGGGGGGATTAPTAPPATAVTTTTVPPTTPTSTTAATPTPTATASTSSDDAGSGAGGSSGPAACRESQLRAVLDARPVGNQKTKTDKAIIVDFINKSSTSCTMHGYPGAALVDSSGAQVKQATRTIRGQILGLPTSVHTLPTVTLKPGGVAAAGIEGVDQQQKGAAQAGCADTYPRILVTPPNTSTPVPFAVKWPVCYSFTVHPTNLI